jgi:V8-like Glu-specific endopeptidase
MPLIRVNRESVDDRFSVLGFTVRVESPLFEVGIATDPALFRSENRARRSRRNFFSSRVAGALRARRGEAVYLVPPDVLANFVGQPKLYFGMATYRENSGGVPDSVQAPSEGTMYVDLSRLTERGLRRVAGRPGAGASYGTGNGRDPSLDWGGDAQPGAVPPSPDGSSNAKGSGKTNGVAIAVVATPAPSKPYDDGFGNFPAPPTVAAPSPAVALVPIRAPAPMPAPTAAPAPAAQPAAQSLGQGVAVRRGARVKALDATTFGWPSGLPEGHPMVQEFIAVYNARAAADIPADPASDRTRYDILHDSIPRIAGYLQSTPSAVGDAVLQLAVAVSMQVVEQIRGLLPKALFQLVLAGDAPPAQGPTIAVPRDVQYLSKRIGIFLAWTDVAIQQAASQLGERLALQKRQWEGRSAEAGIAFTIFGLIPVPGVSVLLDAALAAVSMGVQAALAEQSALLDRQYTSFDAAMHDVRQGYQKLVESVLLGLIADAMGQGDQMRMLGDRRILHPDILALLDAHSGAVLQGWLEELAYLGYSVSGVRSDDSYAQAQGTVGVSRRATARPLEIITPFYDPADPASALTCQADAFSQAREEWFAGVPNTRIFPHSAICLLEMKDASGAVNGYGTGFYIGANRILTCGHNVSGAASIDVIPGCNDTDEPFGRFNVATASWRVPSRYDGGGDYDLAVIDNTPVAAPGGLWFDELEELNQSRPEGVVVCGYSRKSDRVPELTQAMNGRMQHLHAGYIAQLRGEVFDYPILTLHRASGSPVYYLSAKDGTMKAYVVGVHISGELATTQNLNTGCRLTEAKIGWIDNRAGATSLAATRDSMRDSARRAIQRTGQPRALPGRQAARAPAPPARAMIIGADDVERAQRYAPQWADLFGWSVPDWIPGYLAGRDMTVQRIADAVGALNLDRYEVRVATLPSGHSDVSLLEHVRTHLDDFIDTDNSEFIPYAVGDDDVKWASTTAVGAVFKIDIVGPDNAAVVASMVEDRRWRFSTVRTPWSGAHPVSGHREFGVRNDSDGTAVVYTRGADRATDGLGESLVFFGADRLWKSFQRKLVDWVNANGGSASAPEPFSERFHPSVVDILYGHGTVAQSLSEQSFSVHWDTVPYYSQQSDSSCWAAAAAMVVAWRDGVTLTDADIAAKVPALDAYRGGLWPTDRHLLADVWNLVPEPPACYTVDAWRSLLESYGPLYLDMTNSAGSGGHAWVLVGMTGDGAPDGSDTVMYLHNPTASRGRVKWNFQDFQGLYEGRVGTEGSTLEYQVMHAASIPNGIRPVAAAPFSLGLASDVGGAHRPARARPSRATRALAGSDSDYAVPLIPQPDKNACWAAAMAMLLSFRRSVSINPETVVSQVGGSLMSSYGWDLLQAVRERYGFVALDLPSNTSLYLSAAQWSQWLRELGPLWVVIVGMPHAVVVAGLRGDTANASACEVKILNPWDTRVAFDDDAVEFHPANSGYTDWLSFTQFASDFGNMAEPDYGNWRVLHLPDRPASSAPASAQGRSLALSDRSAARSSGGHIARLAPPPRPVRAMATGDGAALDEPIEPSRVIGTTMRRQRGLHGRVTWALDQLDGVKLPDPSAAMVPALVPTTITLDQWPSLGRDAVPLPLSVRFDAGGGAVGNVRISASAVAEPPYDVTVTATIEDDAPAAAMSTQAALRVTIDYDFIGAPGGDAAARIHLRLVGNGRYDLDSVWQ